VQGGGPTRREEYSLLYGRRRGRSVGGGSNEDESDGTTWLHSDDDDDENSFASTNSSTNMYEEHHGGAGRRATATRRTATESHGPRERPRQRPRQRSGHPVTASTHPSPLQRVISGQKKSAAIAQAATWEATRLREQVTAMEKRFLSVSAQLKGAMEREQSLKMGRGRDKLATKELRYRNLYLAKELAQVKDLAQEASTKTRAQMNGMANSLHTLEEAMASRSRGIQREVRHLRGLLTSLQRQAVRGTGPAAFSSGKRILTAMWQAIETIHLVGVPGGSPLQSRVSSRRPYFTEEPPNSMAPYPTPPSMNPTSKSILRANNASTTTTTTTTSAGKNAMANANANELTHDLAETMDGIVGDLERENQRLRTELEMLQTEILHHKSKTESIALIPQYRQAVVRAREHAELLRQRLRNEIQARNQLQEELAQAQDEVRKLKGRAASQTYQAMHTEKELAVTNLRTAYVSQAMDDTKHKYRNAYSEFATTTMQQQQVIEELQEVITAQRNQLEELNGRPGHVLPTRERAKKAWLPPPDHKYTHALVSSSDSEDFSFGDSENGKDLSSGNTLTVLHSDLEKLDAEIKEIQNSISTKIEQNIRV